MRKNLFLLVLAFVSAFALVSCIQSAPEPTGDVENDGKALADYIINKACKINSVEDFEKYSDEVEKLESQFKDYYDAMGDKAKINRYVDYYVKYHPKYEEALKNIDRIREKKELEE